MMMALSTRIPAPPSANASPTAQAPLTPAPNCVTMTAAFGVHGTMPALMPVPGAPQGLRPAFPDGARRAAQSRPGQTEDSQAGLAAFITIDHSAEFPATCASAVAANGAIRLAVKPPSTSSV